MLVLPEVHDVASSLGADVAVFVCEERGEHRHRVSLQGLGRVHSHTEVQRVQDHQLSTNQMCANVVLYALHVLGTRFKLKVTTLRKLLHVVCCCFLSKRNFV